MILGYPGVNKIKQWNTGKMRVNGKVMGNLMKRIIRLRCSMLLMGVLGIGQLFGVNMEVSVNKPPIGLKRIAKHVSYPGVQGSPIVQEFYLWVEVSKKMKRSMKKQTWKIDFDSFYWSGYRGLGSYGNLGAEVKSMRISSPTNEWRYWKDRFAIDSANKNWMLIVGTLEIPTRNEYDFPVSGSLGLDSVGTRQHTEGDSTVTHLIATSPRIKRVKWESGDPELLVFYSISQWEPSSSQNGSYSRILHSVKRVQPGRFQKVSQSVIRVDKISRVTAVFHP